MMMHQRNEWYWRALHFCVALLVPLMLVAMMSCMKAEEEKEDLGPEVSGDDIDQALSKSLSGASIADTALNQYLEYSVIRRLENEETVTTLGGTKVEVIDCRKKGVEPKVACQPSDIDVTFTLRITMSQRKADNTFEVIQKEESLDIRRPSFQSLTRQSIVADAAKAAVKAGSLVVMTTKGTNRVLPSASKPIRTSYHRLRETTATIAPPAAVKDRSDCGGLSPCELPVRYVQFDLVQWYSETEYQKIKLDFAFSIKTPYLPFGQDFDQLTGVLITDCRATYVKVEGRTVYVRDCFNLEDFAR